jgi:hypothetical protein
MYFFDLKNVLAYECCFIKFDNDLLKTSNGKKYITNKSIYLILSLLFVENLPVETRDEVIQLIESGDLDGTINLEDEMVSVEGIYENLKSMGDTIVFIEPPEPENPITN